MFELSGGGEGGGEGGGDGGWGDGGGASQQQHKQQEQGLQPSVGGGSIREDAQAFLASLQASTSVVGGGRGGRGGVYPPSPKSVGPFQG